MKTKRWYVPLVLTGALILAGCQLTTTGTTEATSSPSEAVSAPDVATLSPEEMPTAEPLWTATPAAEAATAPEATTVPEEATQEPATAAAPAASAAGTVTDPAVVAVVNGQSISRADYEARLTQSQTYFLGQPQLDLDSATTQADLSELQQQALSWMVDEALIEQYAQQQGIEVTAAQLQIELNRMRGNDQARFDEWLAANGMTLATLQEQLRIQMLTSAVRDAVTGSLSQRAPQVYVRHILLSDEVTADKVLQELQGGANFIATARQYSEDQATKDSGGELGWIPRGVLPPELEDVAFSLQPGQISDIIKSDSGLHIIQVVETDPDRSVSDELWPVVQQRSFDDWLQAQRAASTIAYSADVAPASS